MKIQNIKFRKKVSVIYPFNFFCVLRPMDFSHQLLHYVTMSRDSFILQKKRKINVSRGMATRTYGHIFYLLCFFYFKTKIDIWQHFTQTWEHNGETCSILFLFVRYYSIYIICLFGSCYAQLLPKKFHSQFPTLLLVHLTQVYSLRIVGSITFPVRCILYRLYGMSTARVLVFEQLSI